MSSKERGGNSYQTDMNRFLCPTDDSQNDSKVCISGNIKCCLIVTQNDIIKNSKRTAASEYIIGILIDFRGGGGHMVFSFKVPSSNTPDPRSLSGESISQRTECLITA